MLKQENLEIERQGNRLNITYRWRTSTAYGLLFFAAIWNGILLLFLFFGAGLYISVHLLIGLLVAYYGLCLFLNRTVISVNSQQLTVSHGPLPSLSRNQVVISREVKQLYLKRSGSVKSGNKTTQLYALKLRARDKREVKLMGGIPDKALGEEVERAIEEYLDIVDVPVEEQFEMPDLGFLKKFIPEEMQREMEEVGREVQSKPIPPTPTPIPAAPASSDHQEHADHLSYDFALCHAPIGAAFQVRDAPYRLTGAEVIEWTDVPDREVSKVLQASPLATGPVRQFYTYPDGNQWVYFEERPLDAEEREMLGFDAADAPPSLRNGDERYHVLSQNRGVLKAGHGERPVEEWIYYSSRATTRFRAMQLSGRQWRVAVQEPVDSSYIEATA
ncbi:hypothetical protein [Lewinella sp. IMCC34191]|uniref:hypothetical protein n=1 Tax=Lewinella sp. IMCC34191 TaxID=2259172 RepID=UPI000E2510A4|nr:hypothetical protein [Lewinella sp. IMCC34191]